MSVVLSAIFSKVMWVVYQLVVKRCLENCIGFYEKDMQFLFPPPRLTIEKNLDGRKGFDTRELKKRYYSPSPQTNLPVQVKSLSPDRKCKIREQSVDLKIRIMAAKHSLLDGFLMVFKRL